VLNMKFGPSEAAVVSRAPCLEVCERGVWVCLLILCVRMIKN
jgi:hypothetical protein